MIRPQFTHLFASGLLLIAAVADICHAQFIQPPASQPKIGDADIEKLPLHSDPLTADELLLIYNANDPDSKKLAYHYAKIRQVPTDRLLGINVKPGREAIAPKTFELQIRQPVRKYLEKNQLQEKVRCLVTFYGLPIRVDQQKLSPERQKLFDKWHKEFLDALDEFERIIDQLDALGLGPIPTPHPRKPSEKDYQPLLRKYQLSAPKAQKRILSMDQNKAVQFQPQLVELIKKSEGVAKILQSLQAQNEAVPGAAQQQLEQVKQILQSTQNRIQQLLSQGLDSPARDEARRIIRHYYGLVALMDLLNRDIEQIKVDKSQAAVDSELSLLWWDDYPKQGWVWNSMNWRLRGDPGRQWQIPKPYWNKPVLMVGRIDASTPQIAQRMIDDAVAVEHTGINGKVYIDSRGLSKNKKGLVEYDENLNDLAVMLWKNTQLVIRRDNLSKVFGPGQCPQAMLYCGWYSLRQYVDAFDFVPGAVGYHIASFEAISLKKPGEQGWCKRLLEDGVAATLGPVAEPYLQSFPLPTDFFGLLLTGRFTLAECYTYSLPFNSWMMMLLGDPLYRPFQNKAHLELSDVFDDEVIPAEFKP